MKDEQVDTETATDLETEIEEVSDVEPDVEAEPEPDVEPDVEPELEPVDEVEADVESEDAETVNEVEPEVEPEVESQDEEPAAEEPVEEPEDESEPADAEPADSGPEPDADAVADDWKPEVEEPEDAGSSDLEDTPEVLVEETAEEQEPDQRARRTGLVVLATAVLLVLGLGSWWVLQNDADPEPAAGAVTAPVARSEVRVTSRLDGDALVVEQQISSVDGITTLSVGVPPAPSGAGPVRAEDVRVAADGVDVKGESTVTGEATYAFAGKAHRVTLRYRLNGLLVRSRSVPGRALLSATALDLVVPGPAAPVVHRLLGVPVTAMGCTAPDGSGARACGEPDGEGWQVDLTAAQAAERLTAQVQPGA